METEKIKTIGVIAGYDSQANLIKSHRDYVLASCRFLLANNVDLIMLIGGFTNPDIAQSEAGANWLILRELGLKTEEEGGNVKILPYGNTAAEALKSIQTFLLCNIIPNPMSRRENNFENLILCCEKSRLAGLMADALQIGLLDLTQGKIISFGYVFPESAGHFATERKTMLLKVLSHRFWIFRKLREWRQRRHQKKVARLKRQGNQKAIYP